LAYYHEDEPEGDVPERPAVFEGVEDQGDWRITYTARKTALKR
jgi:hypothetical protein